MAFSKELAFGLNSFEHAYGEANAAEDGTSWYEHIVKYPTAVVADIGTTFYNFLVPDSYEVTTPELLANVGFNMDQYAEDYKGAVEFGSFIGGSLIPGIGVSKAIKAAAAGKALFGSEAIGGAVGFFEKKAASASLEAIKQATAIGGKATQEYLAASRSAKLWTLGAAAAENTMWEASISLTMSEHGWFENGWNPEIAAIGIVAGTGLTAWGSWAARAKSISNTADKALAEQGGDVAGNALLHPYTQVEHELGGGTSFAAQMADARAAEELVAKSQAARAAGDLPNALESSVEEFIDKGAITIANNAQGTLERMADPIILHSKDKVAHLRDSRGGFATLETTEVKDAATGKTTQQLVQPSLFRLAAWTLNSLGKGATGIRKVAAGVGEVFEKKATPWITRYDEVMDSTVAEYSTPETFYNVIRDARVLKPHQLPVDQRNVPAVLSRATDLMQELQLKGLVDASKPASGFTLNEVTRTLQQLENSGAKAELYAALTKVGAGTKDSVFPFAMTPQARTELLPKWKLGKKGGASARIVPSGEEVGKLEIDIRGIKDNQAAWSFVALQSALHPDAAGVKVLMARNSTRMTKAWDEAVRINDPEVLQRITELYPTAQAASAALATHADPYYAKGMVATFWDGAVRTRDSLMGAYSKRWIDTQPANVGAASRTLPKPEAAFERGIRYDLNLDNISTRDYVTPLEFETTGSALPHVWDEARISAWQAAKNAADVAGKSKVTAKVALEDRDLIHTEAAYLAGVRDIETATERGMLSRTIEAKADAIFSLNNRGWDSLQISIATNTPLTTIETVLARSRTTDHLAVLHALGMSGKATDEAMRSKFFVHTSLEDLVKQQPSINFSGQGATSGKALAAKAAANMDRETMDEVTRAIVHDVSRGSGSKVVHDLYDKFVGSDLAATVRADVGQLIRDAKMGNVYTSLEFTMRKFGSLAASLSRWGSDFESALNNGPIKSAVEQLRPAFNQLAQKREDLIQFEQVVHGLHALGTNAVKADELKLVTNAAGETRVQIAAAKANSKGQVLEAAKYLKYATGAQDDIIVRGPVATVIAAFKPIADDLFAIDSTLAKLRGTENKAVTARGIWFPYKASTNEMTSFMVDPATPGAVWKITSTDLAEQASTLKRLRETPEYANYKFYARTDEDLGTWRDYMNVAPLEHMESADALLVKQGIVPYKVRGTTDILEDLQTEMRNLYLQKSRAYVKLANEDVFSSLDQISAFHTRLVDSAASKKGTFTKSQRSVSPATAAKAMLLNTSLMGEKSWVGATNDHFSIMVNAATQKWKQTGQQIEKKFGLGVHKEGAFAEIDATLKETGQAVPWLTEAEYIAATTPVLKDRAKEFVSSWSAVAATVALRLFDLSHASITTLSIPLLVGGELMGGNGMHGIAAMKLLRKTGKEYMDALWAPNTARESMESWKILEQGRARGIASRRTSEATELIRVNLTKPGLIDYVKGSKFAEWVTKPSDFAEEASREMAYLVGYRAAEQGIPNASKELLHTQATLFTNRAMGNYTARQRPVLFQGSAGQAIGLFQTFMWTFGQNVFRYAEDGNIRALAGLMGGYGGMFGMSSLPFYDPIDRAIGAASNSRTNDDFDITQRVYAAFGANSPNEDNARSAAEFLLYGAPSALLQTALYTRTELQPRLPTVGNSLGGLPLPPAMNMMYQSWQALYGAATNAANMVAAAPTPGSAVLNLGRAITEGVAMQTVFRPAARAAELILGTSMDQKGATIANEDDIRGVWPTISRVMGSRPLKEQVIRNQAFRHSYYDSQDQVKTRAVIETMRQAVRSGATDTVPGLMTQYLDAGGGLSGWRQQLNTAYLTEANPGAEMLKKEVRKQRGIAAIMDGYSYE